MKLRSLLAISTFLLQSMSFDLTVNDEHIDDPINVLKSKFKPYIPELENHLEIPVSSNQLTLKDSFIPHKIKMKSLRSKFRQEMPIALSKLKKKIHIKQPNNENQEEAQIHHDSIDYKTGSKLQSKRSWIKDFLKFKDTKLKADKHRQLQSSFQNYDDTINDPQDLKRWVKSIVDQDMQENNNIIRSKSFINQNEIEIDIEEFIDYLVNEQGFNSKDLQFLKLRNLDYGLHDIENELGILIHNSSDPRVIHIGGEENGANNRTFSYFGLIILLLFLN